MRLHHDRVRRRDDGSLHDVLVFDSSPWVNVVVQTVDEKLLLVRQYRHGSGEYCWEVPGGLVDAGEEPAQAALRELREEAGYSSPQLEPLAVFAANPAIQSNDVHLFVARQCVPCGAQQLDPMEDISVHLFSPDEVQDMLDSGQIRHPLTAVALLLYLTRPSP